MLASQPPTYPVNLCLQNQPVLVVGAGAVALRKVRGLLAAGAQVTVVAPEIVPELKLLADEERVVLHKRPYAPGEARRFHLVFSATGVDAVDRQVAEDARQAGLWVNVADVPELCSFYLPAVIRRGHLQLSITTDGTAPFAARRVRERLEQQMGLAFSDWLVCAGQFREAVLAKVPDPSGRDALFERFFTETWPDFEATPVIPAESDWRGWITAMTASATALPETSENATEAHDTLSEPAKDIEKEDPDG